MMCWFRNQGSHVFAFIAGKAFLKRIVFSQDRSNIRTTHHVRVFPHTYIMERVVIVLPL